jgi:hypothetical protein
MKHHGIIAIVFIVGCATGGVAAQLVVPPVRAGTSPTRWEYKCAEVEDVDDRGGLTTPLDEFGDKGWELVSLLKKQWLNMYLACAKRPLR